MNKKAPLLASLLLSGLITTTATAKDLELEWNGWRPFSPRDEIRPSFSLRKKGGPDGQGGLQVTHDARSGLDGAWSKIFEVEGDAHYQVTAFAKCRKVGNPRANRYLELFFHDKEGQYVVDDRIGVKTRPFYPLDEPEDESGWVKFSGIYQAPASATHATVRLHLRWEPRGEVEWGGISFLKSAPRIPRKVRLAAINFRPKGGKTGLDNCRQCAPFIERAANQKLTSWCLANASPRWATIWITSAGLNRSPGHPPSILDRSPTSTTSTS